MNFRKYRWLFILGVVVAIFLWPLQDNWLQPLDAGKVGSPVAAQTQSPDANELRWEGQDLVLQQNN